MRCKSQSGQSATRRHCHSPVNVLDVAFRAEWQCISHCHSLVNVPHVTFKAEWQCNRYVRCRVAVKGWGLGTLGAEWQCGRDCQTGVSVPNRYDRGRVAVKGWGLGTLGAEWQCNSHCHSPVNVPRVAFKVEWQCGLAGPAVQTPEKPLQPLGSRHRRSPVTP